MVDNSRIVLENKKEYHIIDKIKLDKKAFVYLSNLNDPEDFCVRKEIEEKEKTYLVGLDNEEEAIEALKLFTEKNNNIEAKEQ